MKIVIDTNIYISASLGNFEANEIMNSIEYNFYISNEIFDELKKVIYRKKFKLNDSQRSGFLTKVESITKSINVSNRVNFNRDREDSKLLELCNEIEADYLITEDYQLLKGTHLTKTPIISLDTFYKKFILKNG